MRKLKSFLFQNTYIYTFETGANNDGFFCVSLATLLAPGVTIDPRSERQPRLQHERKRREGKIRQKHSTHPFNWDTFGISWEDMGSFGMDPNLRQGPVGSAADHKGGEDSFLRGGLRCSHQLHPGLRSRHLSPKILGILSKCTTSNITVL